jgi:AbiTii
MSLLEEIQADAVNEDAKLGPLLRKCKVWAARVGSAPLAAWLIHESNGYPDEVAVPNYRTWRLHVKGDFLGAFNSAYRNASIPMGSIPEHVRGSYERYEFRQSVANAEASLAASVASGKLLRIETGDLCHVLGLNVYSDMNCVAAWGELSPASLVELLNAVRNRILDLALAVWKEQPTAGEASTGSSDLSERVTQQFMTIVHGGTVNVVGSAQTVIGAQVIANNMESLRRVLREQGVAAPDIEELQRCIRDDPAPAVPGQFGTRVSGWIGKMVAKAAGGSWEVAVGAAGNLLATLIARYYGLST